MPQPLQLLEQCASRFNPVLHRETLWIFSYVLLHQLQGAGQNEGRPHPVFSEYTIFYILPSDPRLPVTFLMLVIPGFTNLLDRRSSASWLILPLPCNALTEVAIPPLPYEAQHFLCSWLLLNENLSPSSLPHLTLSLLELKWLSGPCQV